MNRSLLTPRWLLLHVLFLTATIATGFLSWWQWERAYDAGGSFQNLGYALMWPLFGMFTIFLWYRLIRLDLLGSTTAEDDTGQAAVEEGTAAETTTSRRRPLVPPSAPPVEADEDPELAAYNQYLAELNRADSAVS